MLHVFMIPSGVQGYCLVLTIRNEIARLNLCIKQGLLVLSNGHLKMMFAGYQKPFYFLHQLQEQDENTQLLLTTQKY